MTSDILLHDDDLIKVAAETNADKLPVNATTPSLSSEDQAQIQKALATDNLKSTAALESQITVKMFEDRIERLADTNSTLTGARYAEEIRVSAAMASELLKNEEIDSLTRVKACEKVIGLIDDNSADLARFSEKERKEMIVEAASLRMQVARRAESLKNDERTALELKLKGVTAATKLGSIPKDQRDDRLEALYLQALIAGRQIEGTKFKDYLVPEIQAIRRESNIKDAEMTSLIPQAEERLIRRMVVQLENSEDAEVREFVASIKSKCEPDEVTKAGQAVVKELEKGLENALKASATELNLAAEFNQRPLTREMKDSRIETLHRQFAALGFSKEELGIQLEREIAAQEVATGKLSPDLRYSLNDKVDLIARELRKDPSYPSAETLSKAVDKFQASLKPEELSALTSILGDKAVFSSLIVQSVSVGTEAANSDDMKLVNTYANDSRLKREFAVASELIEKQMAGASKSEKQQVEVILSELKVAITAEPGNNVWWGALQTKIDNLHLKHDQQGVVKNELSHLFAKAELRSMAVVEDQYLDLRVVESDQRICKNFERLGLRGERLEDAIHSYARGANALYAEREIERLKRDYIRWGDHYHEAKSNTFGLGLGVPGVKYKKGESEIMLQDATLALRAQGFQGEALKQKVSDLVANISDRYHHDLKMKESTYIERVEELRRHGAAAVELTEDPSRPFRAIPKHDSLFRDDKELYGAVLDRYLPKWRAELEQQGINPNSLSDAALKSYCTEVFKDSDLKVDFADRGAVEKLANLGGIYVALRDTNGGKSKNIPYLEDAQKFLKGELPQDASARMLLEARAQAAFEYCNKHIEEKNKRAAAQDYHNAGGALGMSLATVSKTSDAVIRGVTADWVSPEAIGQWLAGKIGDEKQVADTYKTIDSAYKNLDGFAGTIAHGSERVAYVGGTAAGVFLGTELLHGTKVGAFTMGKVTAMATAGAAHNMVHKDERDLFDRLKDGGIAFAQMMILGKGLEFVGTGGSIVNRLPPSVANKLTPISNVLNPIQSVSDKALSAVNSGVTSFVGQAGNRIVSGAVMNVGLDVPLRLAMGHEVNKDTLIDAALFGACFEACGVYGQKFGTFRSAASEALPKLSNDQLKELLSKESVEALRRVEAFEQSARNQVKEKSSTDLSERQAAAEKVLELRMKAEEVMAPSTLEKIVDSVVHPVETAKVTLETTAKKIENAGVKVVEIGEAGIRKVGEAGEFVKELPSNSAKFVKDGATKVVESVNSGATKLTEVAKSSVEMVKEIPGRTAEVLKKSGEVIAQAPAKTVEVAVEAVVKVSKGIKEIPGKAVEVVKDTGKVIKQGAEAALNAPENLLRAAEMNHLTRGCEGSVDARVAADKFLEARDNVNSSTDPKIRMENLREMVRNQRVIQVIKGNVKIDAQVHDLMVEMLRRGVKPIEAGDSSTSPASSAKELPSGAGLKLDESVFKEIEHAINSDKGFDIDRSTIKELPNKAESNSTVESEYAWLEEAYSGSKESRAAVVEPPTKAEPVKTEPKTSIESEYAWLEEAYNNPKEPSRVVDKPADRFESKKKDSAVSVEELAAVDDFVKQMEASWGDKAPEFKTKDKTKNELLKEGEESIFERPENEASFENEPWTPGKDDGGGVATEAPPKVKTEPRIEAKKESKIETKTEVEKKPEVEKQVQTEKKSEVKPQIEAKPEAKASSKVEAKPELKPEPKVQPEQETALQTAPETKTQSSVEPRTQIAPLLEPLSKFEPELETSKTTRKRQHGDFNFSSDEIGYDLAKNMLEQPKFSKLNFRPEGIFLPGTERKKRELLETQYRLSDKKVKRQDNSKAGGIYTLKNNQNAKVFLQNGVEDIEKDRSEVDIEVVAAEIEKLEFVREDGD